MNKIIQLLIALTIMTAVTGCLDPQDESGGRPKAATVSIDMK